MNWQSYKKSLSKLTNKEKGDSFERLTKHYLKYDPQYATKLKEVWLLSEVPEKIHKKLNLPDQDQGIDLICEAKDGEYWAVQCKYLEEETKSLPWRMLSTFTGLAFGVCRGISFGLVCTTAERFTRVLKQQDNIGFCTGEVWRSLDEDFFSAFTRKRKPKKLKPFKPYAHQRRAIRNAGKHFTSEKRGKMIMPCGTGKSLAAFWIAEKLDAKRILVAVPSLALIRQTLRVWLRESYAKGWDVDWITVCSDESVGKISRDDLAVLKQDLGVPAVTDPKIIAKWLRKRHTGKMVVFTTYQSGKAIAEATKLAKRNFDLGVMDEAHKTVGSKDKTFSHLLFDKNIKIAKRMFMTATERRYRGEKDEVISMDDFDVYGDTFEFLSFKEALEEAPPILSDYKIVTMMISKDEVADLVKKRAFVKPTKGKWDEEIEADMLAAMIALRKAIRRFKIKHAITFHSSIAKAKAFGDNQPIFTDLFPQYWKTDNFHVSGKMPTLVRARHMEQFETSKRAIMTNARCLTEGVDVPDIDCVMFADPKKSTIDIVQAVGRALRVSEGNKFGYVIVPVMIEDEGKFDESDAFQSILMTLKALASNDERIIDYFRARSQNKRTYTNIQIEVDERIAEKIDVKDFTRQLELKVWNKLAKLSWRPFEEAREFIHALELKTQREWNRYKHGLIPDIIKLPDDIPSNPNGVYNNLGWKGIGDWLGTFSGTYRWDLLPYDKAKLFVNKLKLKDRKEWNLYKKGKLNYLPELPHNIPPNPQSAYNEDWKGFGDWLGTGKLGPADMHSRFWGFKKARAYVRDLNLKNVEEYRSWSNGDLSHLPNRPVFIPSSPAGTYEKKGWKGYGDWLGTGRIANQDRIYLHFKKAREYARSLKLKTGKDWRSFSKKGKLPINIPTKPGRVYKDKGWVSFPDWLGTDNVRNPYKKMVEYEEARKILSKYQLRSPAEYFNKRSEEKYRVLFAKLGIPFNPHKLYKDKGWISWPDFLGYEPKRKKK